jgi:hypothetical protein
MRSMLCLKRTSRSTIFLGFLYIAGGPFLNYFRLVFPSRVLRAEDSRGNWHHALFVYRQASTFTTSRWVNPFMYTHSHKNDSKSEDHVCCEISHQWLLTVLPIRFTAIAIAFMTTASSALHPFENDPKIFIASSTL